MKSISIKGKDYIEVNERVKYFRTHFEGYRMSTEMISDKDGRCIFKASIYDPQGFIVSTGHAYEVEGSTFINKTSYIENGETSAIGRALGFLGIGIDASIASADEVANAILNQGKKQVKKEVLEKVADSSPEKEEVFGNDFRSDEPEVTPEQSKSIQELIQGINGKLASGELKNTAQLSELWKNNIRWINELPVDPREELIKVFSNAKGKLK